MELLKRWKILVPILTLVGVVAGFLVKRAFSPQRDELVIRPPPAAQIPAVELPPRERSLSGAVEANDGAPIPDALVWVRAGDEPHWTYTDEQGRFRLEALEEGPWHAKVVARGFDPVAVEIGAAEIASAATEHTFRLGPPLGAPPALPPIRRERLAGTVTSRLPFSLEGAEVVLMPTLPPEALEAPLPRRVPVAAGGRFEVVDLITGEYQAEVIPAWARGGSWPDLARALDAEGALRVSHGAQNPAGEISIALAIGAAHGRLVDLQGAPIEGALVLLSAAADPSRVWPPTSSAADGAFTVEGLPAGKYQLSIRAGSALVQQAIEIAAGESLDLGLAPLEVRPSR